jgi:HD-GYP domain-containing protein (c-di-GMP phosphodiesterase class II)
MKNLMEVVIQRIKEDSITFESRIIAVADAYDAMTTIRPYRAAMEPKIAYSILKKDSEFYGIRKS